MAQTIAKNLPKILLVDDEPDICRNCVKILSKADFDVSYALNGVEALEMLAEEPRDVVITDLKMDRMGGMALLGRIKAEMANTIVIVITGYASVSSAVEVMKLGAFDYLPKPFTPDELRAVVQQAVAKVGLRRPHKPLESHSGSVAPVSHQLVGSSSKINKVVEMIAKVAPTTATVLITGESGTGKELVARAVHANSKRSTSVFFAVDCGTLSDNLLESELFGHTKGAFTGADRDKEGIFRRADGGTVFLDEIGNISKAVQGKLLRFLESREFRALGDQTPPRTVDIRLILATNRNLKEMVDQGRFREDFYYRIFVYPIFMPPLRARREDIVPIANHFMKQFCQHMGKPIQGFDPEAIQALCAYNWPGNVRQLRNIVERAVIQCDGQRIGPKELTLDSTVRELEHLFSRIPTTNEELKRIKQRIRQKSVAEVERKFILNALAQTQWNVTRAAKLVGLQRTNFQTMMRKHGIRRPSNTR